MLPFSLKGKQNNKPKQPNSKYHKKIKENISISSTKADQQTS